MVKKLHEMIDVPKVDVNGFSYRDAKKSADAATKRDGYDNAVLLEPDGSFTIARLGYDGKPVGWEPEGTRIVYISKSDWSGGVHKAIGTEVSQDTFESRSVSNNKSSSKKLNEIRYGEWKHSLPNNPTKYERLLSYVETVEHVCDLAREEADVVLMHLEEAEDFFSDERNYRYYDFDKKMNEIAKIIEQLEQVKRKIKRLDK